MDAATFCTLFREAFDSGAPQIVYIMDHAGCADPSVLRSIYTMARATQRDLIRATGYTRRQLSAIIGIPLRSIDNWGSDHRPMPYHVRLLIAMMCCKASLDVPIDFNPR